MVSDDVLCIINQIKAAGNDALKSDNSNSGRASRGKGSKPGDGDDNGLKEVPPYILKCLEVLASNLAERDDNKRQELKEEFEQKLAEKDELINDLQKQIRENLFSIDAQAQYNRSENIKIHGIEYKKGENTNKIVKDVAKFCGVEIRDGDLSTSHRLMSRDAMDSQINPSNRDTKIPVIIARVNRRDLNSSCLSHGTFSCEHFFFI